MSAFVGGVVENLCTRCVHTYMPIFNSYEAPVQPMGDLLRALEQLSIHQFQPLIYIEPRWWSGQICTLRGSSSANRSSFQELVSHGSASKEYDYKTKSSHVRYDQLVPPLDIIKRKRAADHLLHKLSFLYFIYHKILAKTFFLLDNC